MPQIDRKLTINPKPDRGLAIKALGNGKPCNLPLHNRRHGREPKANDQIIVITIAQAAHVLEAK